MKIVIATNNLNKFEEFKRMLIKEGFEISNFYSSKFPKYEEGNLSFMDNAMGKAYFYSQFSDLLTLSDDSGLVIPALGGFPGISSSRFGLNKMNQNEKNEYIIQQMKNFSGAKRIAYFVCALAVAKQKKILFATEERVKGLIAYESKGNNGFGYDPIFYYIDKEKTFAELTAEEKDAVSHRGKAVRAFLEWLRKLELVAKNE